MPLFVVRPSRGAWVFFGLVALGVAGARAADRHESRVVQQDRPASETAQRLGACLVGQHAGWVFRDPAERDALLRWTFEGGRVLRGAVTTTTDPAWPRRCADLAGRLHRALLRASTSPVGVRVLAQDVRDLLERAAADRDERFALIDGDQIPSKVAALMMQVHALSQGTRSTWGAPPSDTATGVELPAIPRIQGLPSGIEGAALGEAGSLYGRSAWDGTLHALDLTGPRPRDVSVGPAAALHEPPRGGLLRVWRDEGPALLETDAAPRIVHMPRGFRIDGAIADFAWDAAVAGTARALLTVDGGTARVFVAPSEGPAAWSEGRPVGPGESVLGAVITPDGDAPGARRWRVTALRPRFDDATLEQYAVEAADAPTDAAPVVAVGPATPAGVVGELPATVTRVETCRAGAVAYMVLGTDENVTAVRIEGRVAHAARLHLRLPRGARFDLRCDATRALATPAPMALQSGAALFQFPTRGAPRATQLDHPPGGVNEVHAMLLVRDAVLAVVSTPGAVRTWRRSTADGLLRGAALWQPAGLVTHLLPSARTRRAVTRFEARARDNDVTLLLEVSDAPRVLQHASADQPMSPIEERPATAWSPAGAAVLVSRDGGATFASP